MSTKQLYGQLFAQAPLYLALGPPQIWVDQDRDALALAGSHSGWGFCWCQPKVAYVRCRDGHEHPQVTHRRTADMSDAAYDALGRAGWNTDSDGDVYPAGDHP